MTISRLLQIINGIRRKDHGKGWKVEGKENSELGPVVVPKGWDYAAASMRKAEIKK
jgi:hypothetical protein